MGGGADTLVDESLPRNVDTMEQEGGALQGISVSCLYLHHGSAKWSIGIGS